MLHILLAIFCILLFLAFGLTQPSCHGSSKFLKTLNQRFFKDKGREYPPFPQCSYNSCHAALHPLWSSRDKTLYPPPSKNSSQRSPILAPILSKRPDSLRIPPPMDLYKSP
ncbi:Hemolysin [Chlamydia pneumoniae B21]|nr:Hemolysin [Chlamydia pneumoniae B21]